MTQSQERRKRTGRWWHNAVGRLAQEQSFRETFSNNTDSGVLGKRNLRQRQYVSRRFASSQEYERRFWYDIESQENSKMTYGLSFWCLWPGNVWAWQKNRLFSAPFSLTLVIAWYTMIELPFEGRSVSLRRSNIKQDRGLRRPRFLLDTTPASGRTVHFSHTF